MIEKLTNSSIWYLLENDVESKIRRLSSFLSLLTATSSKFEEKVNVLDSLKRRASIWISANGPSVIKLCNLRNDNEILCAR